jgi:hypothetical protein
VKRVSWFRWLESWLEIQKAHHTPQLLLWLREIASTNYWYHYTVVYAAAWNHGELHGVGKKVGIQSERQADPS